MFFGALGSPGFFGAKWVPPLLPSVPSLLPEFPTVRPAGLPPRPCPSRPGGSAFPRQTVMASGQNKDLASERLDSRSASTSQSSPARHVTLANPSVLPNPFPPLCLKTPLRSDHLTGGRKVQKETGIRTPGGGSGSRSSPGPAPGPPQPPPPPPHVQAVSATFTPALVPRPAPRLTCRRAAPRAAAGNRHLKERATTAAILAPDVEPHPSSPRSRSAGVPPSTAAPRQGPPSPH